MVAYRRGTQDRSVFVGQGGEQIAKVRERFGLKHVVFVADRGILRSARLTEDLLPVGLDWITALCRPAIGELIKRGAFQPSLFEQTGLAEITDPAYPGERITPYQKRIFELLQLGTP